MEWIGLNGHSRWMGPEQGCTLGMAVLRSWVGPLATRDRWALGMDRPLTWRGAMAPQNGWTPVMDGLWAGISPR